MAAVAFNFLCLAVSEAVGEEQCVFGGEASSLFIDMSTEWG